jgi:hypothetical protein
MVPLERRLVGVLLGVGGVGVDVEGIVSPVVVEVVADRRDQAGEDVEGRRRQLSQRVRAEQVV